jgi:hypothetical protein
LVSVARLIIPRQSSVTNALDDFEMPRHAIDGYLLTVVDPADDGVVGVAGGLVVKWPRPMVSGGAVVVAVPGSSAR